jgi:hypothetical protein
MEEKLLRTVPGSFSRVHSLTFFTLLPTFPAAVPEHQAPNHQRLIDLDVDIGADAVDYNAIAKQESLSGLEVEMRKLEGVVKEIVEELNYLKRREARMRDTNGAFFRPFVHLPSFSFSLSISIPPTSRTLMQRLTESTNERVKNFFWLSFAILISLGAWQILHLRSYFKKSALRILLFFLLFYLATSSIMLCFPVTVEQRDCRVLRKKQN